MLTLKHNFSTDIKNLLVEFGSKKSVTSVKFISDDESISCDKLLLQMASPVLRNLIDHETVILMTDYGIDAAKHLVKMFVNGTTKFNSELEKIDFLSLTDALGVANFEDCDSSEATSEIKAKSVFEVESQNSCKYCLKNFSRKQARIEHEKTFHEENMHECDKCDKKFRNKIGLETHIKRKHEKNIHYVCETCAKVFENNSSLKRHCITENHEYTEIYKELPKDAKSCDICFKIVTHLDIHKKLYHSDKNNNKSQHKCDKCDFKTKRKDSLLRHLRCVHNLYMWKNV